MLTLAEFQQEFAPDGLYRRSTGEIPVMIFTRSRPIQGKLLFREGLCCEIRGEQAESWVSPSGSMNPEPESIDQVVLPLEFAESRPQLVAIEKGRIFFGGELPQHSSRHEFLRNFRAVRNRLIHASKKSIALFLEAPTEITDGAKWLSLKAIEEFDSRDFFYLGLHQQAGLDRAVDRYRQAFQVQRKNPSEVNQREVFAAFRELAARVASIDTESSPESAQIEKALSEIEFPSEVLSWDCELVENFHSQLIVQFEAIIDFENLIPRQLGKLAMSLRNAVIDKLDEKGIERNVTVSFKPIKDIAA